MLGNRKAAIGFVLFTVFVDVVGFAIIIPVLPDLIRELTGQTLEDAAVTGGLLLFAYAIMQFLFAPIHGELSDRFGRKPILLLAVFGLGLDFILHAYAPTLAWLFVGRIIAGIMGASYSVANAYIADITPPEKKAQNFAFVGVAFGLGFVIGPAIGGIVGEFFGSRAPFYVAAGLSMINFLYGVIVLPESLPKDKRRAFDVKRIVPFGALVHLTRYPVILPMVISFFLIYIAGHSVQSTWNYFTMAMFDWSVGDVGLSLAVVGILVAAVQGGLIQLVVKRLGERKTIYWGYFFWGLGLFLFAFASQGWMMYAFLVPYALGGIAGPTLQGMVSNQVPKDEQGELQGMLTSIMALTSIIGPLVMPLIFSYFAKGNAPVQFPGAAFMAGAILVAIGGLVIYQPLRKATMEEEQILDAPTKGEGVAKE